MLDPILNVDWSVIMYKCWHRMAGANYTMETNSEKQEFAHNVFKYLIYLVERFKPSEVIFAVDDNPNWRVKYYRDYYIKHSNIYKHLEDDTYIVEWDFKIHQFNFNDVQDVWIKKKLKKVEILELFQGTLNDALDEMTKQKKKKMHDEFIWGRFQESIPDYVKVTDPVEKEKVFYDTLKKHTPHYKKRPSTWNYETPKEEFKKFGTNLAYNCANYFQAKVIKADGAEADDIIAAFTKARAKTAKDFICVSVDSDLHQLALRNPLFQFFNPNTNSDGTPSKWGGFIPMTLEKAKHDLYTKILSGDTSDHIFATHLIGQRKLMSDKEAEKLMLTNPKPIAYMQQVINRDSLIKNATLVHLCKAPKSIVKNIEDAVNNHRRPKSQYGPEDAFVTPVQHATLREVAKQHSALDA